MIEWLARYEEDGEVFFRIGRDGDEVVAEWLGVARLVARRDGSAHRLERDPSAEPRELAKIERGGVKLLLRHLAGKPALHGAAIAVGDDAIVLLGRARQGKSTLAAALCAREGVALLSDDAVAVDAAPEGYVVTALEEHHWLDAAARHAVSRMTSGEGAGEDVADGDRQQGKRAVTASRLGRRGVLRAIVDLAFAEGPARIVRASGLEAMAALVPQAVRFVLDDPAVHRKEIESLGRLVEAVPVFRLERPRSLALLPESCDLVFSLLREPAPAASDP
ncbi:MAG TPA: hypothetical protein VM204_05935 [Gaiellaceae bacterium]|nr:hypothetical protein [Gaiellaceae bacterium]